MAHDVFISHAHKDKGIADAICERLESARIRCWIADRDISASEDWTEVTRNAIGASRVMVLVLSENANAASHIEREIAHAFYTGRMILPLRVTDTLPRRDFLFYLGNVRCFDAFSPPAEQHLEAFAASLNGMLGGPSNTGDPAPPQRTTKKKETLHFSDSWIGALQASHYGTLELLKRIAVAASLVAVGLIVWFATQQTKPEITPAQENREAAFPAPGAAQDSTPHAPENAPTLKPAYTYSRLGLWVAPTNGPKSADPPEPQEVPSASSVPQPATATASPRPDPDQKVDDAESPDGRDDTSVRSAQGSHRRTTNRHEAHRRKARAKRHARKGPGSEESLVGHAKRRLKSALRHGVARSGEIGDGER